MLDLLPDVENPAVGEPKQLLTNSRVLKILRTDGHYTADIDALAICNSGASRHRNNPTVATNPPATNFYV